MLQNIFLTVFMEYKSCIMFSIKTFIHIQLQYHVIAATTGGSSARLAVSPQGQTSRNTLASHLTNLNTFPSLNHRVRVVKTNTTTPSWVNSSRITEQNNCSASVCKQRETLESCNCPNLEKSFLTEFISPSSNLSLHTLLPTTTPDSLDSLYFPTFPKFIESKLGNRKTSIV